MGMSGSDERQDRGEWVNWSGSLRFSPSRIERPGSEEEVRQIVKRSCERGEVIRPVGAGHSSTPIIETEDVLLSLDGYRGLVGYDEERCQATVRAGTTLKEAGGFLADVGMAFHTLGDINVQTVVGAICTGTHGSGKSLKNLASILIGGRMVTAQGEIMEFSQQDEDLLRAMRVSLGALGIFTEVKLQLVPSYSLRRQEWCSTIDSCLENLHDLIESNRHFDFYWYPRSDRVKLRTYNLPGESYADLPYAELVEDRTGASHLVIPKVRTLRFNEMEYFLPLENAVDCFEEVRRRVKNDHRREVAWRVLFRTITPDDAYLSGSYGRETATIALLHNASLPFWRYFQDLEPVLLEYGGRPHWAKKHTLRARDLRALYPEWDTFVRIREKLDPQGVFLSPYLRGLLEAE